MSRDHTAERETEPAKPVGPVGSEHPSADVTETAVDCPHCRATSVGRVPFCGACGYDFVTGVAPDTPDEENPGPLPTALQAAEPHAAYVDHHGDAEDIELTTRLHDLPISPSELPKAPDVPAPAPPVSGQEQMAHEGVQQLPPSRLEEAEWVAEVWVDHAWAASRDSEQPVPEAGLPQVVPMSAPYVVIGRHNLERGLHPDLDAGTDAGVSVRHAQLTSHDGRWWIEDLDTSNGTYVTTVGLDLPERPIDPGVRVRIDEDDRVYLGGWTRLMVRRVGTA
ncbi:MAG: FHA domain-containing protein [Ornithinimicrobium sp.]|uniref:FHA domain-containing protein n=1 Tax=Ornithinimicrobium sp. TaxID=1977084 RepID=UPI0026DFA7C0|nr:FHA domain-containing protein [Ornithinimicrobium sp.]MDO5740046.1 FHA domain-containing protein [Ornithinimicrobium sp.]